jgi:multiple sugar transport system substrate-binding protein
MSGNKWISIPLGAAGATFVHRISQMQAAGFKEFPRDTGGFLELCKALKAKNTPAGFALGNATGDGNAWCHWVVWAFGGKMVDDKNNVVINSPETIKALEYAKELYATFIPGTLSWLDPNNNKAFLDGQISVTNNGISIYYAAKNSTDAKVKEMAPDIGHAAFPVGPVGRGTELHLFTEAMVFKYSKFPQAAKAFVAFMMEKEQYEPWQQASIGYVTQPLKAYESNPIWTVDPKHIPYRDCVKNMTANSHAGRLGYASAGTMADFVMVNMVAEAASGSKTPKEAAERAQARAQRYYKV